MFVAANLDLDDQDTGRIVDRFHDDVTANISARRPWMLAWRESHSDWEPRTLGLFGDDGELRAIAPLVRRRQAGLLQIRCLGHTGLDHCPVLGRTAEDAVDLADAVAGWLDRLRWPWKLNLPQLPAGSVFAARLIQRLAVATSAAGVDRPVVILGAEPDRDSHVSRNQRQAEVKARNRASHAGLSLQQAWITDPSTIADRMTEVRAVHRARDLQLRGTSGLDDPDEGRFYDALVRRHLDRMELLEIRLDGDLAAFVLWIRQDGVRLVFDNRVAAGWTNYSAGLIANNEALRTAVADPGVVCLDWGAGVQRYKLSSCNKVFPHEQLTAWSSRTVRLWLGGIHRLHGMTAGRADARSKSGRIS